MGHEPEPRDLDPDLIGRVEVVADRGAGRERRQLAHVAVLRERRDRSAGRGDFPERESFDPKAIVLILGVTTVASLWKSRKDERERLSAP